MTSTFTQIREKLAQQEERLMSDLERAASRVDKVASSTEDEQQLVEVNLESLCFLGQSLLTGDVYDQMSNLPSLEEAVEKRWRTEIPGVVWRDEDVKKINMSDVHHLTLTETSHVTHVLQHLEEDSGSDRLLHQELGASSLSDNDQQTSYTREIYRFSVTGSVFGLLLYNNTIFLVNGDAALYMYSSSGDLIKKHEVIGMKASRDVTVMTQDDGDKLIITSENYLDYIPVKIAGDTCILGNTHCKSLNYEPYGLCVNHNNNLVVADRNNGSLHVYNSSGGEINTINLKAGDKMLYYVSPDPSGSYVVTDNSNQIIWIDGQGAQQRRCKGTACGLALSGLRGVVRDSENRYLVADYGNNQLLLFSKDGGDVRCLIKITKPYSLYLDLQQNKLCVGTLTDQVVVYDYDMLLGEDTYAIKYNLIRLGIKV